MGGGGMFEVASGSFSKSSTVLQKCFSTKIQGVQVQNINWNAWTGSIEVSRDGGATYNAMQCDDCTVAGRTTNIVVDGDGDSGKRASTACLDGKLCGLSWGNTICCDPVLPRLPRNSSECTGLRSNLNP